MGTFALGHFSLIFLAIPVIVPPVPAPQTIMSSFPANQVKDLSNTLKIHKESWTVFVLDILGFLISVEVQILIQNFYFKINFGRQFRFSLKTTRKWPHTYRHKRRRFPELYRRNAPTGYWGSDTENTKHRTVMFYEMTPHCFTTCTFYGHLFSASFGLVSMLSKINSLGTAANPLI